VFHESDRVILLIFEPLRRPNEDDAFSGSFPPSVPAAAPIASETVAVPVLLLQPLVGSTIVADDGAATAEAAVAAAAYGAAGQGIFYLTDENSAFVQVRQRLPGKKG
jgi:hypothetical protein